MKTSELTGVALDWAVAKCERIHMSAIQPHGKLEIHFSRENGGDIYSPSTNWAQGGVILTNARISRTIDHSGQWIAYWMEGYSCYDDADDNKLWMQCDHSELVAGLRCYVAMELGDEIEIPEEMR